MTAVATSPVSSRSWLGDLDAVESRLDIATLAHDETDGLRLNDIGIVRLRTTEPLAVDPYSLNRSTGAFLLVDENGGATVAAGMVAATP